jgi:hypothetical protein
LLQPEDFPRWLAGTANTEMLKPAPDDSDVLMNLKAIVCILLVAAVPMYAQAQSPSAPKVNKGDAEKVTEVRKSALACEPVESLQKLRSIQLICVGGQRSVLTPC